IGQPIRHIEPAILGETGKERLRKREGQRRGARVAGADITHEIRSDQYTRSLSLLLPHRNRMGPQRLTNSAFVRTGVKANPRGATLSWNIKDAALRASPNPVVTIYRIKSLVGKAIELLWVMQNMAGGGCWIITDLAANLDHGKFAGGNAPDELTLVEPTSHDVLA